MFHTIASDLIMLMHVRAQKNGRGIVTNHDAFPTIAISSISELRHASFQLLCSLQAWDCFNIIISFDAAFIKQPFVVHMLHAARINIALTVF